MLPDPTMQDWQIAYGLPTLMPCCAIHCRLYDEHVAAASGRPSKFHHISKAGGTTLCYLAFENGCSGPGMSKKDNCLLDIR
jgi:hypothetical protein